ncbi:MAG: hypothetical protein A3F63_10690 [Pseudomonadales bacterium RIFCSPHIGHO2_12_FULL_40_16]|nr:MAG: hypothetical protein A3F63_10690 [Pseudomonadales bacterium RIFCSPHIGHO2_12_FULL_40_16]
MLDSTQLFCVIDDFFQKFEPTYWKFLKQSHHRLRIRNAQLHLSEIVFQLWHQNKPMIRIREASA